MKRLTMASLPLLSIVGCLTGGLYGCNATREQMDNAEIVLDRIEQIAEKNGAAWTAEVSYDGMEHSIFWGTQVGFRIPVRVTAHIQGNAACGRTPVEYDGQPEVEP